MNNSVLTKRGGTHEVINGFPVNGEAALTVVHHDPNTSSGSNLAAEVSLAWFAELAFTALSLVTRDNMIPRLNLSYTFTNTLNNPAQNKSEYVKRIWKKWIDWLMEDTTYPAASWPRIQGKRPSGSYIHKRDKQNQKDFRSLINGLDWISTSKKEIQTDLAAPGVGVGVTESGEEDLDPNLTGLRGSHLHIFDDQRFVRLVSHRSYGVKSETGSDVINNRR